MREVSCSDRKQSKQHPETKLVFDISILRLGYTV